MDKPEADIKHYKIANKWHDWRGVMYFRVNRFTIDPVLQVVVKYGKKRSSRNTYPVIAKLSYMSFMGNYKDLVEECNQVEFNITLDLAIKELTQVNKPLS